MRQTLAVVIGLLVFATFSRGDDLWLSATNKLECTVLKESGTDILFVYGESLMRLPKTSVSRIERRTDKSVTPSAEARLPTWKQCMVKLAAQPWAEDIRQIPATVVEVGTLANVPYKSQRASEDYEINVYGDPTNPCGVEIGIYRSLLRDEQSKKRCLDFVRSMLIQPSDRKMLDRLKLDEDRVEESGLVFEITPPTAEDAFGGWWISIYDARGIEGARATAAELKEISEARVAARNETDKSTGPASPAPSDPLTASPSPIEITARLERWSSDDARYARPSRAASSSSSGGGRVYVRGYTRKDGTYVQPHSRRR